MNKISFLRLTQLKPSGSISYIEKLNTKEWDEKRQMIIKRDKFSCKRCNLKASTFENGYMLREKTEEEIKEYKKKLANDWYDSVRPEYRHKFDRDTLPDVLKNIIIKPEQLILQVHHSYYILDKLPWDYPDESLITLCIECHQAVHDESDIPIYADETMTDKLIYSKCGKCNGSGYRPEYHYHKNGVCFGCGGKRYFLST